MLSDEEKKAMKYFYNLRATIDESNMLFDEDIDVKCGKETIKQITTILNLIEKQQKEIEELQAINQMQKYRIEVMDERELISRDEVENIIKVKIEEYEEKFKAENGKKTINYHLYRIIIDEVLKPLLDKIKGDDK